MRTQHYTLLLSVTCVMPLLAQAQQTEWKEVLIPKLIQTEQKLSVLPSGWEEFDEAQGPCSENVRHHLRDVSVYDGHPRRCANLIPDSDKELKAKKQWVSMWKLSPALKDGTWIRCSYMHTRMSVCLQLPKTAKEVRITSNTEIPNNSYVNKVEYR